MSATTPQQTCDYCGTAEPVSQLVQPTPNNNYCSETCYLRHRGVKALNQVRQDHRLCASCGRQLKELDKPPEEFVERIKRTNGPATAEAIVGFQDRTPEGDTGIKEYEGEHEASPLYREGTICDCGVVDTREGDDTLREREWQSVLANFVQVLRLLEREGAIMERLDVQLFAAVFKKSREKHGTGDLELALGAGLYR